jgi:hypothetical protein
MGVAQLVPVARQPETYELVDEASAYEWLLNNDHADAVPREVDDAHEVHPGERAMFSSRIPTELIVGSKSIAQPGV